MKFGSMWNEIRLWKTELVRKFEYEKPRSAPVLTEIGDDRGNFEILTEFLKNRNYRFRPNVESFGGHCSKCNSTLPESAGTG